MTPENKSAALAYAKLQFPREACGLIIIERGKEVFVPCRNTATGTDHFIIGHGEYAEADARGEVVGVWHSHPNASAEPSDADRVACEATGVEWHIVSLPGEQWVSFKPSGYRAPLIGRTWSHGVLDCYSIVRDYYQERRGITLRQYERHDEWWSRGGNLYLDNILREGFAQVKLSDVAEGDVILMTLRSPVPNHAAIYLGDNTILHHLTNRLSSRDVYGEYFRRNTHSVYRYVCT